MDEMTITIPPPDREAAERTRERLNQLAKVPGSLGKLETLAIRLAAMTGNSAPVFPRKEVIVFAGDHDIALQGVSATGQEITTGQVRNFVRGGGTINAFSRNAGATVTVVDVAVKDDINNLPGLVNRKIMNAVHDFSKGPAMTRVQAEQSVQTGIDMAHDASSRGITLLAAGEMGIGNTSPSSAIAAVLMGIPVSSVTGIGSGINTETVRKKISLIEQGIRLNQPDPGDTLDVLAKVGGAEIGAMAGLMLGGASLRIPVVVDGFIAGAAAAIARGINPEVSHYLVGSHVSVEPGHQMLMDYIGVEPFFDFGLRLGEGTGAALLFPIIDASVRILTEMILFRDMDF
ncbi:nicotinate-nucleotide--dimethylbenzimidazole phosphoribosyltransferase [Akkermansia sp. N21116]|uniref:nicotinate-nucleotide--dimethylbenzimidazole phosphoribosyltransferase n=1 Tax=Akkermansia sp. N21116 TaxID=3040764 RepID=UPI002AC8F2D6|nr:nicotinate-nucleotide--dimethylbenzimidazole phosphoribosyltransferase [Akkermansia sp. N21116]WPX39823.1 nicotinate-nucleotide--dimethylbenzimidazole phosphoribosyltransferase [Akkermansia sp. N21116]